MKLILLLFCLTYSLLAKEEAFLDITYDSFNRNRLTKPATYDRKCTYKLSEAELKYIKRNTQVNSYFRSTSVYILTRRKEKAVITIYENDTLTITLDFFSSTVVACTGNLVNFRFPMNDILKVLLKPYRIKSREKIFNSKTLLSQREQKKRLIELYESENKK